MKIYGRRAWPYELWLCFGGERKVKDQGHRIKNVKITFDVQGMPEWVVCIADEYSSSSCFTHLNEIIDNCLSTVVVVVVVVQFSVVSFHSRNFFGEKKLN